MSGIHWVKLSTQMFDDEKIKAIRSMPSGDSVCLIWIQLISLAGKTNDHGQIYLSEDIPYTETILANSIGHKVETVRMALQTFRKMGMIELLANDRIALINWSKYQNFEGLDKVREQTRIRTQRYRQKLLEQVTSSDVTVTLLESESESDLESEEEKMSFAKASPEVEKTPDLIPYEDIIGELNDQAGRSYEWEGARGEKNRALIRALWKRGFRGKDFQAVIDNKVRDWGHPPKKGERDMRPYLRPATLFQASKFEGYLNGGGL